MIYSFLENCMCVARNVALAPTACIRELEQPGLLLDILIALLVFSLTHFTAIRAASAGKPAVVTRTECT